MTRSNQADRLVYVPKDAFIENYSPVYSSSILSMDTQFTGSEIEALNLEERGSSLNSSVAISFPNIYRSHHKS